MLVFIMFSQLVNVFDKERVLAVNTDCHDVFNMAGGWGTCEVTPRHFKGAPRLTLESRANSIFSGKMFFNIFQFIERSFGQVCSFKKLRESPLAGSVPRSGRAP